MAIVMMMFFGAIAGLLVGILIPNQRLGCVILLAVPVAMIIHISRWQDANPDALRSTSGLDFIFGPLWPSLGAIAGFAAGRMLHNALTK
jgi:uncharacterized membrane protein YfcA